MTIDESRILKLLTEDPSYTYQDIANKLGVAETSMRNWDNGCKKPSLNLLVHLANL